MNKKTINLILITISFIIWMSVFYKIISADGDDNDNISSVPVKMEIIKPDSVQSVYALNLQKDPFKTPYNSKQKKKRQPLKTKVKKTPKEKPPQLKLLGILSDSEGKLAIIKFPDSTIRFVREKEKYDKIEIIKIHKNKVEFRFAGLKQTISMQK